MGCSPWIDHGLNIPDAWLWLNMAILGYYAALAVNKQLVAIRQASEISHHDRPNMIDQTTENALKLDTLGQLAQSANRDIRTASIRIVTERVIRGGPAWELMLRDITGTNIERRDKALACLRFLGPSLKNNEQAHIVIHGYDTYEAVIDCLCNLLPEARNAEKDESYRTQPERDALSVLHQIFPLNPAKALEAGIIHKWLAQYPFGGEHASKPKRKDVLSRILDEAYYEDNDFGSTMRKLLRELFEMTTLSKEWEACGLLDADDAGNAHNRVNHGWEQGQLVPRDNVAMPTSSPAGVGRTRSGFPVGMNNRRREESPEEQALRRRRREAMVLGETGRPIQRGDIIERDPVFRDEDVEEELEQRLEAVTEAESTRDRNWWGWLSRLRPDGLAPQPSWPIH